MESASFALTLGQGFSLLLSVLARIAICVVVTTVVRRHRPDAYAALMTWAILELASAVLLPTFGVLTTILGTASGVENVLKRQAFSIAFGAVVHLALHALLVRGRVKIAPPAPPVEVPAVGPYR